MPIELQTEREAKVLAQAFKDGKIPEERREETMLVLRSFTNKDTLPSLDDPRVNSEKPESDLLKAPKQFAQDVGKDAIATAEVGLTVVTGGFGEIVGGFNAALRTLFGGNLDDAVDDINAASDLFTFQPRTKRGKLLLEQIAVPLMALERGADRVAETMSLGNPFAAAAIKTALLGGAELALPAKGAKNIVTVKRRIANQRKEIERTAKDLGIDLDLDNMGVGIVDAARRLTPEERAVNAPALKQAMKEAAKVAADERTALFDTARKTRTFIETRSVRQLSTGLRDELNLRGFDLDEMPIVNKRLTDMQSGAFEPGVALSARLNELEKVRRRVSANRSASPSENAALNSIKKGLDDFLDNEFNNIATEAGSSISGDVSGVAAWKAARESNVRWKRNFSEDKAISQLIEKSSTPEQYRQWLVGATTLNAGKQASLTIRRMKQVLGNEHPAIEGIRLDFIFEMVEPLLKNEPNYGQFIRNFEATVRRNPSLVKELDINRSDIRPLLDFAKVQNKLPPNKRLVSGGELSKGLAQIFVGNKLAKGQLRVNLARNITNFMFGIDRISQKQILGELANVKFGEPAIPRKSALAAEFITGAALTGTPPEEQQ